MNAESKCSEELLREVEVFRESLHGAQLQQLFNYLPEIYFVVKSRDGRVMMVNDHAAQLCGFEHESDMIGKTDYDIFEKDLADTYVRDDQHVFATGESIVDHVEMAPDPNNSINWVITTKIPLYSHANEIIGLACIGRNMTAAYEKLRPFTEMNDVLEYVRQNYALPIKIDDLAHISNLSSSQFERKFQKVFKITPTQHILDVRIRAACNMLTTTNDTISSIAQASGFYDHSHFIRGFKKSMGVAPSDYRKQG